MPLLRLDSISLHYGTHVIFDKVSLILQKGSRIGLLGHNGAGKSTLLNLIYGEVNADEGSRWIRPGTKIARLDQSLPAADDSYVFDVIAAGVGQAGELLQQYHHLVQSGSESDLNRLHEVQQQLEAKDGWLLQQKVESIISRLQLDGEITMRQLSGGWRRRVALARALVNEPDLLLLDEPTNHLDIPAIEWLEQQLEDFRGVLLFVTHDRRFLQRVANEIIELDRGHLTQWQGDYQGFLDFREQQLEIEERENALFDKRLAEEEVWIRKGIKARRTRNEGRVRALKAMRDERRQRREQVGKADFAVESAASSGKIVVQLKNISFAYQDKTVIENFSTTITRGDRIGIVGPNGAGKSTLLKIILGELQPGSGEVKLGTKLEIAYFDQLRQSLEMDKTLMDNICGGREFIEINGKRRHGISYLGDFLFSPERVRTPVKALSGGEQNRAILAMLFSKSANVLVLDEPTNDLDVDTLELLEEILLSFDGTVLLVSHDRYFMDNVVTSIFVFEGSGIVNQYVGGYDDWAAKGGRLYDPITGDASADTGQPKPAAKSAPQAHTSAAEPSKKNKPAKLSYKDQRELDALPQKIDELEARQADLENQVGQPAFYQGDRQEINQVLAELAQLQRDLDRAYQRWDQLESGADSQP